MAQSKSQSATDVQSELTVLFTAPCCSKNAYSFAEGAVEVVDEDEPAVGAGTTKVQAQSNKESVKHRHKIAFLAVFCRKFFINSPPY